MEKNIHDVSWEGWETVRLIGLGSFGSVFEVQRKTGENVEKAAVKVLSIPQNNIDIEDFLGYDVETLTSTLQGHFNSIYAEYNMMRKMKDCVNIVSCDDIRNEKHKDGIGWDIYIRMELLKPLNKYLSENIKDVSDELVINLTKDMCNALKTCKKYNVIHRDIKPQNIFISENGDFKLGDFGIAKTMEKTMSATKIGTYKYMAPEVYNNQDYGHTADIYSLGLVLYWLLNEYRTPFMPLPPEKIKANSEDESYRRRFSGEPFPEPAHGSDKLKRIVMKACAYDPKDRYQSVDEMLVDINNKVIIEDEKKKKEDEKKDELKKENTIAVFFKTLKAKVESLKNDLFQRKDKKDEKKKSKTLKIIAIILAVLIAVHLLFSYGWLILDFLLFTPSYFGCDSTEPSTEQTTDVSETENVVTESTSQENTQNNVQDTTSIEQDELETDKDDTQKMLRKCRFEYDYIKELYYSKLSAQQRKNEVADLGSETAKYTSVNSLNLDVNFEYDGYSWQLKWSKGQYGILEGAELGIYNNKSGDYQLSKNNQSLHVDMEYYQSLYDYNSANRMFHIDGADQNHYWVSGYKPGVVNPKKNVVYISLWAEDSAMIDAIEQGLINTGEFDDFFSLLGVDNLINYYVRLDDCSLSIVWYDVGYISY